MDGSTTSISVDPRQQLDDVVDFVNDSWLASTDFDGPTFLWNHMISDASAQDDDNRNNVPVAAPNEVADVIGLTMQWYFDSISSTVPTAERTEDGVSMPRNDMPTFRIDSQALSGGEGAATDHAGGLQRGFPAERDADGGAAVVRPVVRAMGRYTHVRL